MDFYESLGICKLLLTFFFIGIICSWCSIQCGCLDFVCVAHFYYLKTSHMEPAFLGDMGSSFIYMSSTSIFKIISKSLFFYDGKSLC